MGKYTDSRSRRPRSDNRPSIRCLIVSFCVDDNFEFVINK